MSTVHPDETTLLRWVLGDLPERRYATLKKHTDHCRPCRDALDATRRLHEHMAATGDGLAFAPGDPFETRPAARTSAAAVGNRHLVLVTMKEALARLDTEKGRLVSAINDAAHDAAKEIELGDAAVRLACAHVLEEAALGDPAKELSAFAEALAERLANSTAVKKEDGEGVVPSGQLRALASLVVGQWRLFSGALAGAEAQLAGAWRALGSFEAPEHVIAWVEVSESLRRSYLGRAVEGRLLAQRALETLERYGLTGGALRAKHALAVALFYAGRYREAHRVFRALVASGEVTTLDRARAVSGAAFCLAARGRFHEAAKEYAVVRRKLRGENAQIEQYMLQGEMKAALGTAGSWHERKNGLPTFGLPEGFGAFRARDIALELSLTTLENNAGLVTRIEAAAGMAYGGGILVNLLQVLYPRVAANPPLCCAVARTVAGAARVLPSGSAGLFVQPLAWHQVLGEARLLESSAGNTHGLSPEAAQLAREARDAFECAGEDPFSVALADFFEGSALTFVGLGRSGWRSLIGARTAFVAFGQDHWRGRAMAALGLVLTRCARDRAAILFFDEALRGLDPDRDSSAYAATLVNRGGALGRLGRLGAAKASFARALMIARRFGLVSTVLTIRTCLALVEMASGDLTKAVRSFEVLAKDAASVGAEEFVLGARLRAALCLVRLGRLSDATECLEAIRRSRFAAALINEPDVRSFFDPGRVTEEADIVRFAEYVDRRVPAFGFGLRA